MDRPGFGLGLLSMVLVCLIWWLFLPAVDSPDSTSAQVVPNTRVQITDAKAVVTPKAKNKEESPVVPGFAPLPRVVPEQSHSEKTAEAGMSTLQLDYPEKPPVPDYEMPESPEIMPFLYQRLLFKNSPDDGRMGLALYVTVSDPSLRKQAYLQRTYLAQLTTFLASHYDYNAIQAEGGKATFIAMLKARFARRLKGNVLKDLNYAFFDAVE